MSKSDMTTTTDLILRASIAQVPIALRGTLEDGKFGELSGRADIDKSLASLLNDLGAEFGKENQGFKDLLGVEVPNIQLESLALGYRNIEPKFIQVAATVTADSTSFRFAVLKMIGVNSGFVVGLDLHSEATLKNNFLSDLIGKISIENLGIYYASREFKNVKYDPGEEFEDADNICPSKFGKIPPMARDFTEGLNYSAKILLENVKLIDVPRLIDEGEESTDGQKTLQDSDTGTESETKQLTKGSTLWIKTDKSLGPLSFKRVGLHYDAPRVGIKLDAALRLSALTLSFDGLGLSYPINQFTKDSQKIWDNLKFHLDGASVSFEGGPLTISGGLLKVSDDPLQLDGSLLIRAKMFAMSALGSYTDINGTPSFFAFAFLDKDLGGPTFFHVTGLAAGFGVNRTLKLPPIQEVHTFPLIQMAMGTSRPKVQGKGPKWALAKLQDHIMPAKEAYWFAVGVRFSSFEMIESFALLSFSFGKEVAVSILGLSRLSIPKGASKPVAYAELQLKAELNLTTGTLKVEGRLSENSFILDGKCRLTGGFAFYTWFSGRHDGDFVVTIGGYHPRFTKPDHYPVVPRVGIDWPISSKLRVTGELYFALTPSSLMAGGKLAAIFKSGGLKAWFIAYADFLLQWQPFYYEIAVGVSLGVSYTFKFLWTRITLKVELSAELSLWGPPFAGRARITWYIISFTIKFGDQGHSRPAPLTWQQFEEGLLPPNGALITLRVSDGLISQGTIDGANWPVVNAHELVFTTSSAAPATTIKLNGTEVHKPQDDIGIDGNPREYGVQPMAVRNLRSDYALDLSRLDGGHYTKENVIPKVLRQGVPAALWSPKEPSKGPSAEVIPNTPTGLGFTIKPAEPTHELLPVDLKKLAYEDLGKDLGWRPDLEPPQPIEAHGSHTLMNTIADGGSEASRPGILAALQAASPAVPLNTVDLKLLSKTADRVYQASPRMACLGQPLEKK